MAVYVDVIVDPDPAGAPFGKDVGVDRQGLQGRPVQLLVQLPAGDAEPADRPFLVQADEQLADRFRRGRRTAGSAGAPAASAGGRLALESTD
jgi:hypothetical protein